MTESQLSMGECEVLRVKATLRGLDAVVPYVERLLAARIEQARAEGAAEVVARVEALADEMLAFDCIEDTVPSGVDVPDDFEHGVHDSGRRLRDALRDDA